MSKSLTILKKYSWANNERLILSVRNTDVKRNTITYAVDGVASVDKSGSNFFYLTGQNTGVRVRDYILNAVDMLENDHGHILATLTYNFEGGVKLHKVDVYTGKATLYEDNPVGANYFLFDKEGVPKIAVKLKNEFDQEEEKLDFSVELFKRENPDSEWEPVQDNGALTDQKLIPVRLHESKANVILVRKRYSEAQQHEDDPSYTGLYEYNLEQQLLAGAYVDEFADKVRLQVEKLLPGHKAKLVSWNKDKSRLIVWAGEDSLSGAYYIVDMVLGRFDKITSPYPKLEQQKIATSEKVVYQTRDNYQIPAYMNIPAGKAKQGLPFIIFPHAFINDRDYPQYDRFVQFLASMGYGVFQPQFRGTGGLGEAHELAGFGEVAHTIQDDITDGVRWLIAQGIADPEKICIIGRNVGAYSAVYGLQHSPELYKCGISIDGLYDSDSLVGYNPDLSYLVGKEHKDDLDKISPYRNAARLQDPLLMMNTRFDNVPDEFLLARNFYKQLKKLGKDVELIELPDSYYMTTNQQYELDRINKIGEFLRRNLDDTDKIIQ